MTLPSSGPMALSAIRGEFGGSTPDAASEYYAGGANVPSGTSGINGAVPSSGALAFSKFYGTSKFIPISHTYSNGTSGNEAVPSGASHLTITAYGNGGSGGDWDGANDGGGAGSAAQTILVISIAGADVGKSIAYVTHIRAAGGANNGQSTTASCATLNAGAFSLSAGGGLAGSFNFSSGGGGSATGGTTNNNGNSGISDQGGDCPGGGTGGSPGTGGNDPGGGGGGSTNSGLYGAQGAPGGYGQITFDWT